MPGLIQHQATTFFPKILYKGRARMEQAVGKLKRFKRIALRCEKTARNYGSFVALALVFVLINASTRPSRLQISTNRTAPSLR